MSPLYARPYRRTSLKVCHVEASCSVAPSHSLHCWWASSEQAMKTSDREAEEISQSQVENEDPWGQPSSLKALIFEDSREFPRDRQQLQYQ